MYPESRTDVISTGSAEFAWPTWDSWSPLYSLRHVVEDGYYVILQHTRSRPRRDLIPTAQCPDMFAWLVPFAALRC